MDPAERTRLSGLLEKRVTFHRGLNELKHALLSTAPNNDAKLVELLSLVQRVVVLLRTRYANPAAWKASVELLRLAEDRAPSDQKQKCSGWFREATTYLDEGDVEGPSPTSLPPGALAAGVEVAAAAAAANLPLEDVLAGAGVGLAGQQAPASHYDDTGPILDDEARRRRIEGGAEASTAAAATEGAPAGQPGRATALQRAQARMAQQSHLQSAILEGIQAVYRGMEAVARGTEAVERELDAVLEALRARAGQPSAPSRPPASRRVVASLPRRLLETEAQLDELGRDTVCPVCTEAFALGDEVQLLPCKPMQHCFHPACVKPWLDSNNSCPVCRTELPTDDLKYEAAKERAAEEEAERRGAANALSHNEFAYL
ncbi:hypothetical protein HYH03_004698 [Edaphochlamys debaryana]|uniref:RING-type E3 ubiquitin transferase n=1 Tax=Edaphochlamys debaryana TaxID=47281 RepID=A0A835Y8S6_9CHLO|nr:hypothetical protein HYH03_004698 [Edaphochlamys debaryana]|eukprot:KAG2497107.1 hypothetical protein HYH03_004698 [Edaphochlamys debaryana]